MRKTALFKKLIIGATAALVFIFPCFAEFDFYSIPDSAKIRESILDTWLKAPLSRVKSYSSYTVKNDYGTTFQVRWEESDTELSIIVAPQSMLKTGLYGDKNTYRTESQSLYPKNAPGSWVLYRDKTNGRPVRICYYFNKDSDVYVQFRADGGKTFADMVIFDAYACRYIPVGVSFDKFYTASLSDVNRYTSRSLPWSYVDVVTGQYHSKLQMIEVIRENQKYFKHIEDVCYDENGELIYITSGKKVDDRNFDSNHLYISNAGFVKWVIDGITEPLTGMNIDPSQLVIPTVEYDSVGRNGILSQTYNLSFALDWTRNLAAKCISLRNGRTYDYKTGGVDVTFNPFVFYNEGNRICSVTGYIDNTGSPVKNLKALLYVLSLTEPSYFYVASIKEGSDISYEDMVYNKSVIFMPYFNDDGFFDCVVFEDGKELSLDDFIKKYDNLNTFVHMERVRATDDFFPKTVD